MDCLFCKIIAGSERCAQVYEDDLSFAFMDIHPLGDAHVLLIPKQHVEKLEELDAQTRQHLYRVYDFLLAAQRKAGFGVEGTHLLVNDGKATNQHIPHAHLHLIPRKRGDAFKFGYRMFLHFTGIFGFATPMEKLQEQAEQIKAQFSSLSAPKVDDANYHRTGTR
ncbi:HIT family protein [Alkalilimnicola ehrlichii]|uniref:HIT family protein n=1 Tax=Alkalilimnicola ehrlichii TaxID=351052 RepID=A0A3E0WT17_9GAMM|nr:HIT family protein [Alkalilimnicola ehrlichii]RFA29209.1 HIT family protein [Alkalilimnicola ehrlichii]RFA36120.1 HIT family protein [Alkalilimnicola ehrlichii]